VNTQAETSQPNGVTSQLDDDKDEINNCQIGVSRLKSYGRPKKNGCSVITEILKQKEVYQKRHMYIINQDGDGMPTWLVRVRYLM
jgi:hypothetical protein